MANLCITSKIGRLVREMPKPKVVRVVTASYVVPWHLANTLKRLPHDFDVTVVGQSVSENRGMYPDVNWVDIDLNRKPSLFADLYSLWVLCRFFQRHRPDIVHSIMPKAGLICALAAFICRVPIRLHTFTGQVWANKKFPARPFYYWLDRIIVALNTACLTDSASQSGFLRRHHISCQGKPLPVLGKGSLSGVDMSRFTGATLAARADSLRAERGIGKNDFVFVYIARKSRDKGAIDMIEAFSRVANANPDARLLFIGPDESEGVLASMKTSNPALFGKVIDIGRVDNHEEYLRAAQVLCLPSRREGFGSIVIDAAAAGIPAIGSNIVGLVDSIDDGISGMLVPAGDIDKFVQAMQTMIEDPRRCEQMGMAARNRVEAHFTADMMYALLKDYYQAQLARSSRRE